MIFLQLTAAAQNQDYLLWAKTSEDEELTLPRQSDLDTERNLFVIGLQYKRVPYLGNTSDLRLIANIFLRKYDTHGNLQWSKSFGSVYEHCVAGDVKVDHEGNIIFSGYINDPDGENFNQPLIGTFLCKMNPGGQLLWAMPLSKAHVNTWGNTLYSSYGNESKMEIDEDNSIVIFSGFNPSGESHSSHGLYITRYSPEGILVNQYQITHDINSNPTFTGGIAIDGSGNFIITGYYFNGVEILDTTFGIVGAIASTTPHVYVAMISRSGELLWAKSTTNGHSAGTDVAIDHNNNIYLTGVAHGKLLLGADVINSEDTFRGFVAKFSQQGEMSWVKVISGTPSNIKATPAGELYVTGSAYLRLNFDQYNLSGLGEEVFILKINADRSYESALLSRGVPTFSLYRVAHNTEIDDLGNVYTVGIFQQRMVLGCDTLKSVADDMFIFKYNNLPPLRALTIDGPDLVCEGSALTLSSGDIPLPADFFWKFPEELTVVNVSFNEITFQGSRVADSALVQVVVVKECYAYESVQPYMVHVLGRPGDIVLEDPVICEPTTTRVTSSVAEYATSYIWALPDGVIPQQSNETNTPFIDITFVNSFTEGIITAKASNECFEGNTSPPINMKVLHTPSSVSFINSLPEYCSGHQQFFEVTPVADATDYVWQVPLDFDPTGIITSQEPRIVVTPTLAGNKTITVFGKNDCYRGDSAVYNFSLVDPLPAAVIIASACSDQLASNVEDRVTWFRNDMVFARDSSVLHSVGAGVYYFTASNVCGTVQSTPLGFEPFFRSELFIPNVITPNADSYNTSFTLSPPSSDFEVEIFTRWGNSVYHNKNYQNDWGAEANPGIYYIRIQHPCLDKDYVGWLQVFR